MPAFPDSRAFTANQSGVNPLTGWQYEFIPAAWSKGAYCRLLARATTTGIRATIYSGSQTIVQRSVIQGGGTAGVTPTPLNTPTIEWVAAPGDRLITAYDEVAAGTPTLDSILYVDPL